MVSMLLCGRLAQIVYTLFILGFESPDRVPSQPPWQLIGECTTHKEVK